MRPLGSSYFPDKILLLVSAVLCFLMFEELEVMIFRLKLLSGFVPSL